MTKFQAAALCVAMAAATVQAADDSVTTAPWPVGKAHAWYAGQPWPVGCNFIPSTAINQLEMWQEETFDLPTIERELGLAQELGFTSVRVFLHDLLWATDSKGLLERMEKFLAAADERKIRVMFVIFDSVWDPYPKAGRQPEPRPRVMGSAWVQSPGADVLKDPAKQDALKGYVTGVIGHFRNDPRICVWDIHNEPDMVSPSHKDVEIPNKVEAALQLIRKAFGWAREARPSQPLTSGVWTGSWSDDAGLSPMQRFQVENSDVISFHSYGNAAQVKECVDSLRRFNRPVICTEYMARPLGSTFDPVLGYFQEQRVGAYNWGLVLGRTQTNYPWDSWEKTYTAEPELWFHDIFFADGKPYSAKEVEYIRSVTGRAARQAQRNGRTGGAEGRVPAEGAPR